MESPSQNESNTNADLPAWDAILKKLILAGWVAITISALLLTLTSKSFSLAGDSHVTGAIILMFARLFGVAGFGIGVIAIFNRRWNHGVPMLVLALILPFIALWLYGTV